MHSEASGRNPASVSWSTIIPVTRPMARANQAASSGCLAVVLVDPPGPGRVYRVGAADDLSRLPAPCQCGGPEEPDRDTARGALGVGAQQIGHRGQRVPTVVVLPDQPVDGGRGQQPGQRVGGGAHPGRELAGRERAAGQLVRDR